jgi:hypothetical protein
VALRRTVRVRRENGSQRFVEPGLGEEGSRKVQAHLPVGGWSDHDPTGEKLEVTQPNPWPELGSDFVI